MPISFVQFFLLQTCDRTPLVHQLSRAKPMAQSTKRAEFRPRLRSGDSPWKIWKTMVAVREARVRTETVRS